MGQDIIKRRRPTPPERQVKSRYTPGTLLLIIKRTAISPSVKDVCEAARISRDTLDYWLMLSKTKADHKAFDVNINGEIRRFHQWYEDARKDITEKVLSHVYEVASGSALEHSRFRGKMVYKEDPELLKLAGAQFAGTSAVYLRDENGNPIPETFPFRDMETARWWLTYMMPETFGKHQTIDVNHRGGVLVVRGQLTTDELEKKFGGVQTIEDVEFTDVEEDKNDPPTE